MLNASLAGIAQECRRQGVSRLYGALGGAEGILTESLADMFAVPAAAWDEIALAPGSVLGTSRPALRDEDFAKMLEVCRKYDVRSIFLTGGNGTMGMALALSRAALASGRDVSVIGVPKTIDNDLAGTDHSPGYASAARFFAHALRDIGADNRALPGITVVEILGRNAGWLAAATVLARRRADDAPHLIYLPERPLSFERLAADVDRVYTKIGRAVIAVCEGQLDEKGQPFGADTRMSARAPLALNLAHVLSQQLGRAMGLSPRSEKPGLLGRVCSALVSVLDREEAMECGRAAVRAAQSGITGCMITLEREPGATYQTRTGVAELAGIAGRERLLPVAWLPPEPDDDLPQFRAWLEPLTGPVPPLPLLP